MERDVAVSKQDESQDGGAHTEIRDAAAECEIAETDKMHGPFDTVRKLLSICHNPITARSCTKILESLPDSNVRRGFYWTGGGSIYFGSFCVMVGNFSGTTGMSHS